MNSEISIGDLTLEIMKLMGVNVPIVSNNKRFRPENSEVERLVCNNEKLLNNSKWEPQYNLEESLLETIEWFNKNSHLYKAELYNV